jgi:hypothetical protein
MRRPSSTGAATNHQELLMPYARPRPGKSVVYYTGFLMFDRKANRDLDKPAREAWEDYFSGHVLLVQRKVSDTKFDYVAIGCARG